MTRWQQFRLWRLKRRARRLYMERVRLFDVYDCGGSLIDTITGGRLSRLDAAFKEVMDDIRSIDPSAPKGTGA